jgi:hypothetical protein
MKLYIPAICVAAVVSATISAAPVRQLSFYEANYTKTRPTIDGKLDDACYKQAKVYKSYYVYFKPNPEPGKLKTEFRMLYDNTGVYLGIVNYEKNLEKVRKKYTVRDAPALWTDDCAEIYFDPYCDGVGFTKFVVSAGGVTGDSRRIDAAVSLPDWNGSAWNAAVSFRKDAWVIEAFFPWQDLGGRAASGSLWKFCHVRYAWSTGKFIGVSSSPGGCYNRPEDFGYIYFAGEKPVGPKQIGELLAKKATPPWCLAQGDSLLMCEPGKKIQQEKLATLLKSSAAECRKLIETISKLDPDALKSVKTDILAKQDISFACYSRLADLKSQLSELRWKLKLEKFINDIK